MAVLLYSAVEESSLSRQIWDLEHAGAEPVCATYYLFLVKFTLLC